MQRIRRLLNRPEVPRRALPGLLRIILAITAAVVLASWPSKRGARPRPQPCGAQAAQPRKSKCYGVSCYAVYKGSARTRLHHHGSGNARPSRD